MIWSILNSTSHTRVDCAGERGRAGSSARTLECFRREKKRATVSTWYRSCSVLGIDGILGGIKSPRETANRLERSWLVWEQGQQGRCANELAPSVTAIRTIAPRAFARRWTEQPRPRGARDVRVALESRPASVAPARSPQATQNHRVRLRWIRSHHAGDLDSVELCLGRRLEPGPKPKTRRAARREGWCRFARRASRASRRSPGGRGRSRLGASPASARAAFFS